ncbi:MAG: glycoside hydrolase [Clostridiales bacterium]|jgi:predicted neuraminidase|nr:glycoside hydrolase [Clostridiales bacterium]
MKKHLIYRFGGGGRFSFGREPVIRRLPDGALVCTFLTGGDNEPRNNNVAAVSYSADDGASWTEPETLFSHGERGCWVTEIFTETERPFTVVQTYNTNDYKREFYRELKTYRSFYKGGTKWSEPVSFPAADGVSFRQGIVLSDGAWLFPLYWSECTFDFDWTVNTSVAHPDESRFPFRCGVAVSRDGGKSFERHGYIADKKSLWEPNCVELENGRVLMLMRDDSRRFLRRADSFDYGKTWTKPAFTDIPNADTKNTLFKIGGKLFLINNFNAGRGGKWPSDRTNLEIRISEDGEKWELLLKIEPSDAVYFYPHAYVDYARQKVYVAYENKYEHLLSIFDFEELGAADV